MKTSDLGSRYGFVFATVYLKMSDSESASVELAGLASLASSPAHSCGLGSLAASDDDGAAGSEDRPVPLVICFASADLLMGPLCSTMSSCSECALCHMNVSALTQIT